MNDGRTDRAGRRETGCDPWSTAPRTSGGCWTSCATPHEGDQTYFASWRGDPSEWLDGPGTAVAVELARAVSAGVAVNGMIWRSHLDRFNRHARDNRDFVKMLQRLGGSVVLDQRIRVAGSHHQKFVVIRRAARPGADIAFVGGIDLSYSRRDDGAHRGDPQPARPMAAVYGGRPAWHDVHLEIQGPAVVDVEHCFRERWADPTPWRRLPWLWLYDRVRTRRRISAELPPQLPPPPRRGPHAVQLLRTYPHKTPEYPFARHGERSVARGYRKALSRAREFIYVEDQFLWSRTVARVFAETLRRQPGIHMIAVVPEYSDLDSVMQVGAANVAHRQALDELYAAGGDRVEVYELENDECLPVYVHAKVCVVDDVWAAVGSANLNRRSWTHDCELTAVVYDESAAPPGDGETVERRDHGFARDLRLRLWKEHLGRADQDDDADLLDVEQGAVTLRHAAADLDEWHDGGCSGPRPDGRLRRHATPTVAGTTRVWGALAARTLFDPDGRPFWWRRRDRW